VKIFTNCKETLEEMLAAVSQAEDVVGRPRFSDHAPLPVSQPPTSGEVRAVAAQLEISKYALDMACAQQQILLCRMLQFSERKETAPTCEG
jgi:hypothetical protein